MVVVLSLTLGAMPGTIGDAAAGPRKRNPESGDAVKGSGSGGIGVASIESTGLSTSAGAAEDVAARLVGPGVQISNVQYRGEAAARGFFAGGAGIVGFEDGIILSSGCIGNVVGPNASDSITDCDAHVGGGGDTDLEAIRDIPADETYDAAVLEFDFVPDKSTVSFRYVFASEEYNEYVGSAYNDVFGFFVNGNNCAEVEVDTAAGLDPVSINTINNDANAYLYRDNDLDDTAASINTEMDGLTVVLTCNTGVAAGETNHLKLAVADVSDGAYDSSVFLQSGSFTTEGPNKAPDCVGARPSKGTIGTINPDKFFPIKVTGVTDQDFGDTLTIAITSIFQDEPTGKNAPDGKGVGTTTAKVRMEAAKTGNGRFYHIGFSADDGNGGSCSGTVLVRVKVNDKKPIDGGATYDSTM